MSVKILDANDNSPEFLLTDDVTVDLSEDSSPGLVVAQAQATDRDTVRRDLEQA